MLKRDAGAFRDTKKRTFGDLCLYTGAPTHELRKIAQLRRTAGQNNPLVNNVRGKLRWRLLKYVFDCLYHLTQFARDAAH